MNHIARKAVSERRKERRVSVCKRAKMWTWGESAGGGAGEVLSGIEVDLATEGGGLRGGV